MTSKLQIPLSFQKNTLFRHVVLENGLSTLLIQNLIQTKEADPTEQQHQDGAVDSSKDGVPQDDRSSPDDEQVMPDHPSQASESSSTKCLCALNVNVGFTDDLFPGNAHFVEHLLFCGSHKFPEEDHYSTFLKTHSGEHNAFTSAEDTNFFYDISVPQQFEQSLNIFSQFFTCPLFKKDTIKRELKAIDSEFTNALQNDSWALMMIVRSLGFPPFSNFGCGNSSTVHNAFSQHEKESEAQNSAIQDQLRTFFETHYSSHRMNLILMSTEHSLDEMEHLAQTYFSSIERRDAPLQKLPFPFPADALPMRLNVCPVRELRNLFFFFPIQWNSLTEYKYQPIRFWTHILTFKSEGSLFEKLYEKGWIKSLDVSSQHSLSHIDFYCFEMHLQLTEAGEQHEDEICHYVFQYLHKIRSEGPSRELWEEAQQLSEIEFNHYQEKETSFDYASMLAKNMTLYEPGHILSGPYLYFEYNEDSLANVLKQLSPDNVIIISQSQRHETSVDQTEEHYGGRYSRNSVPNEIFEKWITEDPNLSFQIPSTNPYIPDDLQVYEVPDTVKDEPELLHSDEMIDLWWMQDNQFRRPKEIILFSFLVAGQSTKIMEHLYSQIFLTSFSQMVSGKITHAQKANLSFDLSIHNRGFDCVFFGFSQKLPLLVSKVFKELNAYSISEDDFPSAVDQIVRGLKNYQKEMPVYQILHKADNALYSPHFSFPELLEACEKIDFEKYEEFVANWLREVKTRVLVVGNCTKDQAMELMASAKQAIPKQQPPGTIERPQIVKLKKNTDFFYQMQADNKDDTNSSIVILHQLGLCSTQTDLMSSLYGKIVAAPFFDQLRTKESCGYIVHSTPMRKHNTMWLCFLAQSAERDPTYILSRIESFLTIFHETLCKMSQDEFEQHKEGLIQNIMKQDDSITDVMSRAWKEIDRETLDFHRRERYRDALKNISLQELVSFSEQLPRKSRMILQLFSSNDKDKKGEYQSQDPVHRNKEQVYITTKEEMAEQKKILAKYPMHFSKF